MGMRLLLTRRAFDGTVEGRTCPLLVAFLADGCPACDLFDRELARLCDGAGTAFVLTRCDAWERPDLVARFGILTLPTLLVFIDGREVLRLAGLRSAGRLARELTRAGGGLRGGSLAPGAARQGSPTCETSPPLRREPGQDEGGEP